MPWFKVDDGFCFHPKAITAGNSALGLWVRAGSWCGANLTGGALPRHMIGTLGAQKRDAKRLVEAGLWCETEAGYQFNSWDDYQPTKAQVEAERAAARERQRRHRSNKSNGGSNGVTSNVTNGVSHETPSRPVPTVVPSGTTSEPRKRATQLPADWAPKDDHLAIAVEYGLDPAFELRKFRDHHEAKGSTMKSWDAAFRTWLNNAKTYQRPAPASRQQETNDLFDAAWERAHQVPYDMREIG